MPDIETLVAERDIYRALTSFARAMDERDWCILDKILLDNATADLGTGMIEGRDAIIKLIRSFLDDCGPTQHLLGNVLIDVYGDEAVSRTYVLDTHVGQGNRSSLTFNTLGDYHDQWLKMNGVWRILNRTKLNRALVGDISVLGRGPEGWREK